MNDIEDLKNEIKDEAKELIDGLDEDYIVFTLLKTDNKITNICNLYNELEKKVYKKGSKEEHREFNRRVKNE